MIPRRLLRWWSMVGELGLGWALLFIGIATFHLKTSLQINRAFPPGHFQDQQVFFQFVLLLLMWNNVCGRHLRLMLSAAQLRVPGTIGPLCLSLAGLALLCGGWFMTSMSLLNEPWQKVLAVLADTMLLCLLPSPRWYWSALRILMWILLVSIVLQPFANLVPNPMAGWPIAVVLALLVVWQLRTLSRPAHKDFVSASLRRLLKLPDRAASAAWWNVRSFPVVPQLRSFSTGRSQPGRRDLVRAVLGPRYHLRSLFSLPILLSSVLIAAVPWWIALALGFFARCGCGASWVAHLAARTPEMVVTIGMANLLLWPLVMFAGVMHQARLAAVLNRQDGEFVELALVPGTGNSDARRRVLLQEALLRPLACYGLWSAGLTGSMVALTAVSHAGWPQYLYMLLQGCAWPLAFAAISWGLLCGALDPAHPWLGKAWLAILFLSIITNFRVVISESPGRPDSLHMFPLWLSLSWAALLLALTACLLRWAWIYARRLNPYCR